MDQERIVRLSKFLSYALRHAPDRVGLELDEAGWADVEAVLSACLAALGPVRRQDLEMVVARSPKQRFAWSEDGRRLRAQQGHTVDVELGYEAAAPPSVLYHGTGSRALGAIRAEGLRPMGRHHVHLSVDEATAKAVGGRRGRPVILRVDARAMNAAGNGAHGLLFAGEGEALKSCLRGR